MKKCLFEYKTRTFIISNLGIDSAKTTPPSRCLWREALSATWLFTWNFYLICYTNIIHSFIPIMYEWNLINSEAFSPLHHNRPRHLWTSLMHVFIIHFTSGQDMMHNCTFWFSLRVNQIYGDSCKDLWILLTKCTPYYTVSGKSTCPILGWGTPRTCDVYGCMSAIFSHSTRTEYQATHLPSPRMWNPKNMWCFHRAQEHSITCPALGCGTPRTAQSATPSRLRTRFSNSAGATWEIISCKFGK